jgi:hypothetical protein
MAFNYFGLVRDTWPGRPVASPPPKTDGPTRCCAMHAAVIACSTEDSLWRCGICGRLWSVQNPPVEPVEGV